MKTMTKKQLDKAIKEKANNILESENYKCCKLNNYCKKCNKKGTYRRPGYLIENFNLITMWRCGFCDDRYSLKESLVD